MSYADDTGEIYSSKMTTFGVVDSTEIQNGEVQLFIGKVGFPIDKIVKVTRPDTATADNT